MLEHLSEQQVERYRQRSLSPAELLSLDDHVRTCEACRNRLAAVEPLAEAWSAWAAAVSGEAGRPAIRSRAWRLLPGLAAAALAVLVTAAVLLRAPSDFKAPMKPIEEGEPSALPQRIPEPASPVLILQDGEEPLAIDREGRLSGLATLPASWRQQVAAAIRTRRLERPAVLAKLAGSPAGPLRSPAGRRELAPISPVATVVRSNPPEFRWQPLPGAESYQVTVLDSGYRWIAESHPSRSTSWTPEEPLPDARVLVWQVVARRGGEEVLAPRPPAPEVRFQILDRTRAAELDRAAQRCGGSHLALAVLYAEAGLVEEAVSELQALEKMNQDSEIVRDLLQSVQSWGQPSSPSSTNPAQ